MNGPVKVDFPELALPYWCDGIDGVSVYSPHLRASQMQADARRRGRRLHFELDVNHPGAGINDETALDLLRDVLEDDLRRNPKGHPCRGCGEVFDDHPVMGCEGWH